MRKAWLGLAVFCVIAFVGDHVAWPSILVFIMAGVGTIPAAALLGRSTEEIALGITAREVEHQRAAGQKVAPTALGSKVGGLLNATFGNVPEMFIGVLALHDGYITLVKATIAGSVIGNATLVLGMALLLGGFKNGTQRFDAQEAGHHAVLMALAVTALILPSLFWASTHSSRTDEISVVASVLLLVIYVAYLLFSLFQMQGGGSGDKRATFIDEEAAAIIEMEPEGLTAWPLKRSLGVLAGATLLLFISSEALVDTVGPFTARLGWSPFFVGIVVVPILGNMAEQSSAIMLAFKNRVNTALGIASGSSIQVAVLVAPLLVLISQFGHHMTLAFKPIEIAVLSVVVVIFFFISQDGESNWLEGLQLVVLYALAATVFFYVPGVLQ